MADDGSHEALVDGGAAWRVKGTLLAGPSTGFASGECGDLDNWAPGRMLVVNRLEPVHYSMLDSCAGVICSSGGLTGHMPSVSRARGVPVVRVLKSDLALMSGIVTIDLSSGEVIGGSCSDEEIIGTSAPGVTLEQLGFTTAVISGSPDICVANASVVAPLVNRFFIREEFVCLEKCLSPLDLLEEGSGTPRRYVEGLATALYAMYLELLPHQTLVFRLLDLRSDDARKITVGRVVESEPNPELGFHGARWIVSSPVYRRAITAVIQELCREAGVGQIQVAIPFVTDEREFSELRELLDLPSGCELGAFIETPAAVHSVSAICAAGASEVFIGTKDIVQFFLAVDRGNHIVAHYYDTRHPAVLDALQKTIVSCRARNVGVNLFALSRDLPYYLQNLPSPTGYMMCTAELISTLERL